MVEDEVALKLTCLAQHIIMVNTRRNASKGSGLVVSVQLEGLMDIVRLGRRKLVKIACREYVKQYNVKFRVKSSRKQRSKEGLLKCSWGGRALKLRTAKQLKSFATQFNEGYEDDYFTSKLRSRRNHGKLWKGRLLADEESSADEADEYEDEADGEEKLLKQTSVGQTLSGTAKCRAFENAAEEETKGETLEEDAVHKKAMEQHYEVKEQVDVIKTLGSVSPSHWCSAVASYTLNSAKKRLQDTPKKAEWRSPSPSLLTEKQHAAFQARKLKEINSRKGKSRKKNLVKCLQKDFAKEVFVKKDDFAKEESVKKESTGFLGPAQGNFRKTGLDFVKLLSQTNCVAKQKEEECSESESEEYFSD